MLDGIVPLIPINYGGYKLWIPQWVYDEAIRQELGHLVPLWKESDDLPKATPPYARREDASPENQAPPHAIPGDVL